MRTKTDSLTHPDVMPTGLDQRTNVKWLRIINFHDWEQHKGEWRLTDEEPSVVIEDAEPPKVVFPAAYAELAIWAAALDLPYADH